MARFYVSIFKNSKIGSISRYTKEGYEIHVGEAGSALAVAFQINGQAFTAMNGGPIFKFTEAVSFQIFCETQEEIDDYWQRLTEEGEEGQCGWLKDKYGLSWQVAPKILPELMLDANKAESVMKSLLKMTKLEIHKLLEV